MHNISVVIPVYNEEHSLAELDARIVDALKGHRVQRIYVDDVSTDGSREVLLKIKREKKENITIVCFRKHLGKSAALQVGFQQAKGEIVVTIDADLQDDPYEIPRLIEKLTEGYQLVSGYRLNRNDSWQKIMLSRLFNTFVRLVTGIKLQDFNTGLKVYTNDVTQEISLYGELHRYIPVLAVSRGFRVTEVPVRHHKRKFGKSKFGTKRVFQAGFDFLSTWFLITFKQRPMQLFGMSGSIAIFISIVILCYLSYLHFVGEKIGDRPLLLFGIMLFIFGVQLFSTGLLAELLTSYNQDKEVFPIEKIIK